jgi:Tfp pilus assembly protein PilN
MAPEDNEGVLVVIARLGHSVRQMETVIAQQGVTIQQLTERNAELEARLAEIDETAELEQIVLRDEDPSPVAQRRGDVSAHGPRGA